jgi:tRNA-dihydrouridine synthase
MQKSFARNLPSLKRYLTYCTEYNCTDVHRIKQVISYFLSGFPQAAQKRQTLHACKTTQEVKGFVKKL